VTLQLTALTIEREWESRTRINISSSRFLLMGTSNNDDFVVGSSAAVT